MTIAETTFALVDTETTGTDPAKDELVELAVHRETLSGQVDGYSTLIFPLGPVPPESSAVHHLTADDLVGYPRADDVLHFLAGFVSPDDIVTAHNAPFDRSFVPCLEANRWLCTERLAHHLLPDAPNFKLQTLRYYLGFGKVDLEGQEPHRADADLIVLRHVFYELLRRYTVWCAGECGDDEARFAKSQEIDTLLAYVARPYPIKRMMFGKHRGDLLEDVPVSYVRWMLGTDIDADLRWNLERRLKRTAA